MAIQPKAKSIVAPSHADRMENLAASVHSYESFGRAIVASILSEAAKQGSSGAKPIQGKFDVKPMQQFKVADNAVGAARGAGNAGAVGASTENNAGCVSVVLWVGEDGGSHCIKVCNPM